MRNPTADLPAEREALSTMLANAEAPALPRRQHKPSPRAQRVWDRLGDWYGARFADMFGDQPSQDWSVLIDRVSNEDLVAVLMLVRERHVTFPPTLPEFASLVKEARMPRGARTSSVAEQLTDFVARTYPLTPEQLRGPWTFLFRASPGGEVVTGVVIDADGAKPGYRISVEDMRAAEAEP